MKSQRIVIALGGLLITLVSGGVYFAFSVNSQLNAAIETITDVNCELQVARDSVFSAQKQIHHLAGQLQQGEVQLQLIRSQVEVIDLNHQKEKAESWQKLQHLKQQLKEKQEAIADLQQEAAKFPY